MRLVIEALLVIGGALALFRYGYGGFLKMRRRKRQADFEDRRREDEFFDQQLHRR